MRRAETPGRKVEAQGHFLASGLLGGPKCGAGVVRGQEGKSPPEEHSWDLPRRGNFAGGEGEGTCEPFGSLSVLAGSTLRSPKREGTLLQQVTGKVPRETQKWMVLNAVAGCREREHSLQKLPLVSTQSPETRDFPCHVWLITSMYRSLPVFS